MRVRPVQPPREGPRLVLLELNGRDRVGQGGGAVLRYLVEALPRVQLDQHVHSVHDPEPQEEGRERAREREVHAAAPLAPNEDARGGLLAGQLAVPDHDGQVLHIMWRAPLAPP